MKQPRVTVIWTSRGHEVTLLGAKLVIATEHEANDLAKTLGDDSYGYMDLSNNTYTVKTVL